MNALTYTLIPVGAAVVGGGVAVWRQPGPTLVSTIQHFAAGVVFAAAAGEILPDVMHGGSPTATLVGGALGVLVMLLIKKFEERARGPVGLLAAVGIDILVDGLVLGLAFIGGQKAGVLLTIALTVEILFLGLTVTTELNDFLKSRWKIFAATAALSVLLPLGAIAAAPVHLLPAVMVTGFLSFGLMALLYLVTEELLVDAHQKPDTVWISSAFFVGFLALLALEELMG
ncbi:ZIP family metal transporter [Phenylobacterium aquaticum]|uniref:ZIP family metal transporter n=1 Tax=Phenylobacterium aquaticum TaxID=1763816 RepID=UPI001F5DBBC7|nr:transporter [Phenylobacterium aquaticum]MCI3130768.1 transporter [Phenylobacterium aquaticum]